MNIELNQPFPDPCNVVRSYPATRNQRRYVTAQLAGAGSYMISMGHRVGGALDADRLKQAFSAVVARHEALRTAFEVRDGAVWAMVHEAPRFTCHITDLDPGDFDSFRDWALPLVFDDVDPSDAASLVRLVVARSDGHWRFLVAMHHAISDGFSRGVVNREVMKLYAGEDLADVAAFSTFATRKGPPVDPAATEAFVAALPPPVRIPGDGASGAADGALGVFVERAFDGPSRSIQKVAKAQGTTKFGLLAAIYGLGLRGFVGQDAVASFFQGEGRQVLEAPLGVVGSFSNTMPLDLSVDPDQPFGDYAAKVSANVKASLVFEESDILDRTIKAGKAPHVSLNLFPPAARIRAGEIEIGPREFLDRRTEYDLNLVWTEDSGVLRARAFYNAAQISAARAEAFLDMQMALLAAALEEPQKTCRALVADVRRTREVQLARIETGKGPENSLYEAVFAQFRRTPEAEAIVTSTESLSYRDLIETASGVAAVLGHQDGGGPVAILARRTPAMVAAMLGVSAAGRAFAVLDAGYPEARLADRIEALGAGTLIGAGADIPEALKAGRISLDMDRVPCEKPAPPSLPRSDIAYYLFTSGTTGTARRIGHPAATLLRFVAWQADRIGTIAPRTAMLAGLSHDPIMRDIFLPLTTGGRVTIPTDAEMTVPCDLAALVRQTGVDTLHVTPATGRLLSVGLSDAPLEALAAVFWGGDTLSPRTVAGWRAMAPKARQFNLYGASETPQAALIADVTETPAGRQRVPVGHPVPWVGAALVSGDGQTVAAGELGEIVIDLGDPVEIDGARQDRHATGDLGIFLPDTGIHYVGRRDQQVKINGNRIELAEIETVAEAVAGISAAAATLIGEDRLALFCVWDKETDAAPLLRAAIDQALPAYMHPARIIRVDHIPLTANGKVDHARLCALEAERNSGDSAPKEPPRAGAEDAVARIFAQASGLAIDTRHRTLADLGADSLSTIEARMALEKLGLDPPEGWEWMSIADLAGRLDTSGERSKTGLFGLIRVESFILLRTLAIVLIVMHHSRDGGIGGASLLLIALAGFAFGRLQLPAILDDGKTGRIWALLARLLVPLVPVSILVFAVHSAIGNNPSVAALFFYQNLLTLSEYMGLSAPGPHKIAWLWFLHVYIQMFLVIGLVFAVPSWRRRAATDPWRAGLVALGLAEVVAVLTVLGLGSYMGDIPRTTMLLGNAPTTLMPILLLGMLVALARDDRQRWIVLVLAVGHMILDLAVISGDNEGYWIVGLALAVFVPTLPIPLWLSGGVVAISGYALMIYLSHRPVIFATRQVFGEDVPAVVLVILALIIGVLLGLAMRPVLRWIGVHRLAEARVSF